MNQNEPLDYFPATKKPLTLIHLIFLKILPIISVLLLTALSYFFPPVLLGVVCLVVCLVVSLVSFHRSYQLEKPVPITRRDSLTMGMLVGIIFYSCLFCFLLYYIFEPVQSNGINGLKIAAIGYLIPAIVPIILFGKEIKQLHQK